MTTRRAIAAALLALVVVGCWWMLRSAPTDVRPADTAKRDAPSPTPSPRRARTSAAAATPRAPEPPDAAHPWRVIVRVVRASDQTPVADAEVVVTAHGDRDVDKRGERTDAAGVARFAAESGPRDVMIVVRAAGFVRAVRGFFDRVEVAKDVAAEVTIELEDAGAMTGVVLETDGRPLPGARLFVEGFWVHFDVEPFVAAATSGADGRFRLEGLDPRGALVRVSAARHVPTSVGWKQDGAKPVEICLSTGGRIVGVVRDPSGAPVDGATVRAWTTNAGTVPNDVLPIEPQTTTDASGRYVIDVLPLGATWSVGAAKAGFGDAETANGVVVEATHLEVARDLALKPRGRIDLVVLTQDGTPIVFADVLVETASGCTQLRHANTYPSLAIDVPAFPACTVGVDVPGFPVKSVDVDVAQGDRRRVEIRLDADAPIAGVVVDDLGAPLVGVKLDTDVRDAWKFGTFERSAVSGADGSFRLVGLPPGRRGVRAYVDGHEGVYGVSATAPTEGLCVVLRRRSLLSLTVRVPAGAAKPERVGVFLHRPDTPSGSLHEFDWTDGPIVVSVDPGAWRVAVSAKDYATAERAADVAPGEEKSVGLVAFGEGVRLTGRVVDGRGRGVAAARVWAGGPSGTANDAGWFLLEHVAPGETPVIAWAENFLETKTMCVVAAKSEPLVVTLAHGGLLRVAVRDAAGNPSADFLLTVVSRDEPDAVPKAHDVPEVGDQPGERTARLPPGRYRVVATSRDGKPLETRDVELREGEETPVEFAAAK